jgi:hypothetical protein
VAKIRVLTPEEVEERKQRSKSEGPVGRPRRQTMNTKVVSENVTSHSSNQWEWFSRSGPPPYEISGKYLFFAAERGQLVELVIEELEHGGFHEAKIPIEGRNFGTDYVLCLYYKDDSRKHELANKYRNRQGINYRYWKSDEATLKGQYSAGFLRDLPPELQTYFTRKGRI